MIRENICYDDFVRERPYDAAQLDEMIVCSVLARRQADPAPQQEDKLTAPCEVSVGQPEDTDKDVIFKTMEAFRQQ